MIQIESFIQGHLKSFLWDDNSLIFELISLKFASSSLNLETVFLGEVILELAKFNQQKSALSVFHSFCQEE